MDKRPNRPAETAYGLTTGANGSDDVDPSGFESSSMDPSLSWIEWYCRLKENRFFVEVEEDYIRDDFNLTGLVLLVPHYHKALDIVLDSENEYGTEASDPSDSDQAYDASATRLFGLIHARFILTAPGQQMMMGKFRAKVYGVCPNTKCRDQAVMPIGKSDFPRVQRTYVYCPKCRETYYPVSSRLRRIDGAYFGTTFAPLFFMQSPNLCKEEPFPDYYIPRAYGFKVSPECRELNKEWQNRNGQQQEQQNRLMITGGGSQVIAHH